MITFLLLYHCEEADDDDYYGTATAKSIAIIFQWNLPATIPKLLQHAESESPNYEGNADEAKAGNNSTQDTS